MVTQWLISKFVREDQLEKSAARERFGLLSSLTGVLCNLILSAGKFIIGTTSGSVSITADSINNLSDAGSSIVTLIGFKVSGKPADEDHPFGHARAEYIGGLIISFMILLLGVEFFRTSLGRILRPEALDISAVALVALALSIGLKFWMYRFNRSIGKRISSAALLATAQDSLNDVLTTGMVLIATLISKYTGLLIDGWMGLIVAVFVLISGFGLARDTMGPLLGQSPPAELTDILVRKILSYPGILGVHDLVVHSYGPNNWFASVHAEVNATEDILKSHDLIDNVERDILAEMGIHLVIHLDPIVVGDPLVDELHQFVNSCVRALGKEMSMHDFRLVRGETHSNLIFDISVPAGCKTTDAELTRALERMIRERDESFYVVVTVDRSYVSSGGKKPPVD